MIMALPRLIIDFLIAETPPDCTDDILQHRTFAALLLGQFQGLKHHFGNLVRVLAWWQAKRLTRSGQASLVDLRGNLFFYLTFKRFGEMRVALTDMIVFRRSTDDSFRVSQFK